MSDEVKVGDRFEHSRAGGIAVCTGARAPDSERYPCEFQARGKEPYPAECYLDEPHWRRLPREAPTIEERRAALRVGQVITDPALLAKGMRVLGVSGLSVTLSEPREDPTGWNDADTPRFLSDEACAEYGVTFIGWANLLDAKPPAGKPDPTPTGLSGFVDEDAASHCLACGWHGTVDEQHTCAKPQPSPPPTGLPFRYRDACFDAHKHDGVTMCLTCEVGYAHDTNMRDASIATRWPPKQTQRPEGSGSVWLIGLAARRADGRNRKIRPLELVPQGLLVEPKSAADAADIPVGDLCLETVVRWDRVTDRSAPGLPVGS